MATASGRGRGSFSPLSHRDDQWYDEYVATSRTSALIEGRRTNRLRSVGVNEIASSTFSNEIFEMKKGSGRDISTVRNAFKSIKGRL